MDLKLKHQFKTEKYVKNQNTTRIYIIKKTELTKLAGFKFNQTNSFSVYSNNNNHKNQIFNIGI